MSSKKAETKRRTASGIELKPYYLPADAPPPTDEKPGEYPFTRGIHATMYRAKLWTMRQYAGFATAAESNARYRYLLSQGTTGLSVAFDLPTQIGLDSDSPSPWEKWARSASPLIPSKTWPCCLTVFRSTRSRPR